MPKEMQSQKDLDDIEPAYRERLMVWNKIISSPWTVTSHLHYRMDLFSDPKEKEAFKAKYGYDLALPKTWKQYHRGVLPASGQGAVGDGGSLPSRRPANPGTLFSHAAAYTNNPELSRRDVL